MAWYNSVAHAVGNVASPVLEAGGAVTSLGGLVQNPVSNYATNAGHAISNPNVTLAHPSNILPGGQGSFSYAAPTSRPQPNATSGGAASTTAPATYTASDGSTYSSQAAADAANQDLAAYNVYNGQAHTALNDLLGAYNTANQQLKSQYGTQNNELQSGYNAANDQYNQNVTQQGQNLQSEQNQIHSNVANAYHNLLDMLGAYGGGASSVAMQWAPTAAKQFQDNQVGGAQQNEAQNLKSLATNWGNYQNQFDNQKKKLADAQAQDLANNQSTYDYTKGQLGDILSSIASKAVDPSTIGNDLASIQASIPHTKFVTPSYTGVTPTYTAPSVASFEAANPNAQVNLPTNNTSAGIPALALLLGQQKKDQNSNVTPSM